MSSKVFFPGLNGIRAVAALGVLASHTLSSLDRFGFEKREGLDFANSGVTVFFALSGFLITYLLLVEKEKFSRISLKSFYLRRILRIWPLYFFYIAIALVTALVLDGEITHASALILFVVFLPNLAFNLNIYPANLSHLWSLGIEEQFYAFWPLIVSRVTRLGRFLIILVVSLVLVRIGLKLLSGHLHDKLPYSISVSARFDCMAIGALFALAHIRKVPVIERIAGSPFVPLAFWAFVILSSSGHFNVFSIFTPDVVATMTGLFILSQIRRTGTTFLENPFASFLGGISFGIYVYHPLVISWMARIDVQFPNAIVVMVSVVLATVGIAWASFRLIETPFLRWKERFSRVPSKSSA